MPEYASWPRRIAALIIDWAASTFVTVGIIGLGDYLENPNSGWFVLGVFALEVTLLTALAGGSFGQLLSGVRVLATDGRPLNLLMALARTLLICVVIVAFSASSISFIKLIGVAMLVAIVVDALLVRMFVVPATMRLMGNVNWWAPGPLKRWWEKHGFREEVQEKRGRHAARLPATAPSIATACRTPVTSRKQSRYGRATART